MSSSESDLVTFRDGRVVPVAVLRRLWTLEERGIVFRLDDDGAVQVGPVRLLAEEDRAFLHEHRELIVGILAVGEVHA